MTEIEAADIFNQEFDSPYSVGTGGPLPEAANLEKNSDNQLMFDCTDGAA